MREKVKMRKIAQVIEKFFNSRRDKKSNPLDILIATILSQNTNDLNSARAFENLKKKFPRFEDIMNADVKQIEEAIKVGGLAHQKAVRIKKLLIELNEKVGGFDLSFLSKVSVEEGIKFLTRFKGVGLKTASCVLLFGFGREVFPIDTHIHRILNRVGVVRTKTPDETFHAVKNLVPRGSAYSLHTGLIKFGRLICRARNPLCGICPIYNICEFKEKKFFKDRTKGFKFELTEKGEFILLEEV
jgi:endonuclease-3